MCRWLAYYGKPVQMDKVLFQGEYSLIDQSLKSRLGAEPTNGDGFGIGWYSAAGEPGVFTSTEPAWNNRNLREISGHVESNLFFAHIRATTGTPVQQTNCHPFHYGKWLWMHNGVINDWLTIKRDLVLAVDPTLYPLIEGTTDSEVLFYVALTLGLEEDPPGAVERAIGVVEEIGNRHGVKYPFQGTIADHGRRAGLGVPLLERGPVPLPLLLDSLRHAEGNVSGRPEARRLRRGDADHRVRAARRSGGSLEPGSRGDVGRRAAGAGRDRARSGR